MHSILKMTEQTIQRQAVAQKDTSIVTAKTILLHNAVNPVIVTAMAKIIRRLNAEFRGIATAMAKTIHLVMFAESRCAMANLMITIN